MSLHISVTAEKEIDFGVIESNLELLPEMANDFGLFTDGSDAELDGYSVTVEQVKGRSKKLQKV